MSTVFNLFIMTMPIDFNTTLAEINEVFHIQYPFLSLHFFSGEHHAFEYYKPADELNSATLIGTLKHRSLEATVIELHFWQTTAEVEQMLKKKLGIDAQVYRKHEDGWIQTVGSDGLTLEQQNELGMQSRKEIINLHDREKPL